MIEYVALIIAVAALMLPFVVWSIRLNRKPKILTVFYIVPVKPKPTKIQLKEAKILEFKKRDKNDPKI